MDTDEFWTNQTEWHVVQHGPLAICQAKRAARQDEAQRRRDAFDTFDDKPQPHLN